MVYNITKVERTFLCIAGKICLIEKTTHGWTIPKQLVIDNFILLSNLREFLPIHGN